MNNITSDSHKSDILVYYYEESTGCLCINVYVCVLGCGMYVYVFSEEQYRRGT